MSGQLPGQYRVYGYRWVVLAVFMLVNFTIQILWISYATIISEASRYYGVSHQMITLLSMVFMIAFIPLSLPAAWVIDTRGFRVAVGFGVILMGVFGITRGLAEQKFDVTLVSLERDKKEGESYTQFFRRKGLRGVVVRSVLRSRSVCHAIAEERFPMVVVADKFDDPRINFIAYNSGDESCRAIEHLLHLGHRRIALAMHRSPERDHADRLDGYTLALRNADMAVDPALIIPLIANFQGGVSAINQIMSMKNPPTAIYFTDPYPSVGALYRAQQLGLRIPGDLSIVGFDDAQARHHVHPALTAVCQNVSDLGFEAALWLTRELTGFSHAPLRRALPALFEVNASTSVPRKSTEGNP